MRVLAYFGIFLPIFCPWNTSKWSHNNMHGLKLKLVGSFSNNQHSWVILRPTIEKKLRVNMMYFIQYNFAHFWLGFRALAPKRGCWRMVFLINSECPNIIWVGKIDKHHGIFCLGCLTLNKPWGGGIKTQPIWRLPLARWTKFGLNPPYEFFFFHV